MINTAVEEPERVTQRGLVRLAQSFWQFCADFLRDHRDGMDTPAVAAFNCLSVPIPSSPIFSAPPRYSA